jgi:hypothetical protein
VLTVAAFLAGLIGVQFPPTFGGLSGIRNCDQLGKEKGPDIMISSRLIAFVLVGVTAYATALAFAKENTGIVVASRGTVTAEASGQERALTQGDEIFISDQIVTGEKSFAVLQFVDGAKVTVRPNSAMVIEDYVYNGNDADAATLSLVSGGLRVITGAMAKTHPDNYKVKTPVALMGVRGTEFSVQLCGDQICEQEVVE